jgi:hypothetical protein
MMSKKLEDSLGLNPLPMLINERDYMPEVAKDQQAEADVDQVRENLYKAVDAASQAVQDMILIAQQSQHPKAYEALNSIIKTYADVSMGLADLHIKKQRLNGKTNPEEVKNVTNNNLFVGSTAELQKMLDDLETNNESRL